MSKLTIFNLIAILLSYTANAQTVDARGETLSPLHREASNGLGDKWAPYLSVAGLTGVKSFGAVTAETETGKEKLAMKSQVLLNTQLGVYVSAIGEPMHARIGISYTWGQITSEAGNASLNIVGLEALGFYQADNQRIGAGINQPVWSQLVASYMGLDKYALKKDLGYVAEYGYFLKPLNSWVSLRGQYAKYTVPKETRTYFGSEFTDNSVGLGITIQFL